jgi:hypothetical protein
VLFIITQQVQPSLSMQLRQSQHAWIISPHLGSPLVQVMQTPLSVISHLQIPIVKLQQQMVIPLSIAQQLHMPPASIVHRFCTMLAASLSSQRQLIFMPPVHFSNFSVQRGTMSQFVLVGPVAGVPIVGAPMPEAPSPGIPIPVRSIIIVLAIHSSPFVTAV